nr:class I SAM-dependent methyltransferase [Mesorhizobium sp.]
MAIVDALPLRQGMRVLEIGCGPGAAAREIPRRIGDGHVLAIDRSAKAIAQARAASRAEIAAGRLSLRQVAIEDLQLEADDSISTLPLRCASARWTGVIPRQEKSPCNGSRPR